MNSVLEQITRGHVYFSNVLQDKYTNYLFIFLSFVVIFMSSKLSSYITRNVDRPLVKFTVLAFIIYLSMVNSSLAIIVLVTYLFVYNNSVTKENKENFQQMEHFQQMEDYEQENDDSIDSSLINDSSDTEESNESDSTE